MCVCYMHVLIYQKPTHPLYIPIQVFLKDLIITKQGHYQVPF